MGQIEGLVTTKPVNDDNVMYSFTFYDPFVLTMQGAEWLTPGWWSHLGGIPYPATPDVMRDLMPAMIERIPTSPDSWRPAVERVLKEHGEERWNQRRQHRHTARPPFPHVSQVGHPDRVSGATA